MFRNFSRFLHEFFWFSQSNFSFEENFVLFINCIIYNHSLMDRQPSNEITFSTVEQKTLDIEIK